MNDLHRHQHKPHHGHHAGLHRKADKHTAHAHADEAASNDKREEVGPPLKDAAVKAADQPIESAPTDVTPSITTTATCSATVSCTALSSGSSGPSGKSSQSAQSGRSASRSASQSGQVASTRTAPVYPINTLAIPLSDGSLRNVSYGTPTNGSAILPWLARARPPTPQESIDTVMDADVNEEDAEDAEDDDTPAPSSSSTAQPGAFAGLPDVATARTATVSSGTTGSTGTTGTLDGNAGQLRGDSSVGLSSTGKTVLGSVLGGLGGIGLLGALVFFFLVRHKRRRRTGGIRDSHTALAGEKQRSYRTAWRTPTATQAIQARQIGSAGERDLGVASGTRHSRSFQVVSGRRLSQPPAVRIGEAPAWPLSGTTVFRVPPAETTTTDVLDPHDPFSDHAATSWPQTRPVAAQRTEDAAPGSLESSPATPRRLADPMQRLQAHGSVLSLTAQGSRFVEHGL